MARFIVDYTFHACASRIIDASSQEEASERVNAEINRDDFDLEPDRIDDVDFHVREMHPVTRDGREIWTTCVLASDVRGHESAIKDTPLFSE